MGFFETVLGMFVIPALLVCLVLLANGTGRRQLNRVILTIIGIEIGVGGYHLKVINIMTFTNLVLVFATLAKIHRLNVLHTGEGHHHHEDSFHRAEYMKEVYATYRTMAMNLCSIVLTICLSLATSQYEIYKPIKDQADNLKKSSA